jgi:hypothetical protein
MTKWQPYMRVKASSELVVFSIVTSHETRSASNPTLTLVVSWDRGSGVWSVTGLEPHEMHSASNRTLTLEVLKV